MLYYALTIFLSAFLLFQIQPVISRYILPWFGGTPAVWSTSMLFFQLLLLCGYAYAHFLALRWQPKKQGRAHIALLGLGVLTLLGFGLAWGWPLLPGAAWRPPDSSYPAWRILSILLISVGAPYFILSTTGPLLQAWFRFSYPERSPYRLFALSNLGSLLGLVTYPLLVEPLLTLRHQAGLWTIGFLTFAALCAYGAYRLSGKQNPPVEGSNTDQPASSIPKPKSSRYILWIALAACASVMLLATTNQITQEIAVVPFLWVWPLTIYLVSFILCFGNERWYSSGFYIYGLMAAALLAFGVMLQGGALNILIEIGAYSILLFFVVMVCHGELYRLRPDPSYLTSFYLMVSIGGALGGIFVNFAAPFLFNGYWEFQLGILALFLLVFIVLLQDRRMVFQGPGWIKTPLMMGGLVIMGLFNTGYITAIQNSTVLSIRNFYGVLRIKESVEDASGEPIIFLSHGVTNHGYQYVNPELRRNPTAYYGRNTGSGMAFSQYRELISGGGQEASLRIGVIGLGTATLAAYAQPGDYLRFYEINPDVIRLAEGDQSYFTYLADTEGKYNIVVGDARVSLEKELALGEAQEFDLLFIDAFSGDSVPVHLLTREAFELYLAHIKPAGVLALNVSNRHLDLPLVVQVQADYFGLTSAFIQTGSDGKKLPLHWILLSYHDRFFEQPGISEYVRQGSDTGMKNIRLWTDDYSNLFQILK